ncbi:hypothetical protein B0A50_01952 [Salinomyces thailandicus]|uniref:N-acetylgalactosaminide beta-1,3-galactosyltransferase n=1 Tax=Salinomyces thailandicus TaxID=706561 RepID=A0A4U0U7H0_9PEZI|nr:hypothetical protein B0A50_01952 [Salinomyces thailandica]
MSPMNRGRRTRLLTTRRLALCLIIITGIGLVYTISALGNPEYIQGRASDTVRNAVSAAGSARERLLHGPAGHKGEDIFCDGVVDDGRIVVVVKTGATEALEKVPAQLATSLRCIAKPVIVSDLNQTVGRHQIHNVLAGADAGVIASNPDFEIYRKQQLLAKSGSLEDLPSLSTMPIAKEDWRTKGKTAAWGLDKYKFLHMVEKAWELQPGKDWYIFIEADTYLSYRNLRIFLEKYDPSTPLYFGSPVKMWEHKPKPLWFGYGGSGFILSGAVVRDWTTNHPGLANEWDKKIGKMWFGDFVVADALNDELHVQLTDAWPMLHNNEPNVAAFSPDTWCKPVVTMHHLTSRDFDDVYHAELAVRGKPFRFRDVYRHFYDFGLPFKREFWDNLAGEEPEFELKVVENNLEHFSGAFDPKSLKDPHQFFSGCQLACVQNEKCFQFTWSMTTSDGGDRQTECHLTKVFRKGRKRETEKWTDKKTGAKWERNWISGWRSNRISKFVEEHDECS